MDEDGKPLAVATEETTPPVGITCEPQSSVVKATQVKTSRCGRCLKYHWRYIQYCIEGNIFKLPAKYTVPMMFIGKTGPVIVCSAFDKETNEYVLITKGNPFESIAKAKGLLGHIRRLRHMNHKNILGIKNIITPSPRGRQSVEDVYMVYERMKSSLNKVINSEIKVAEEYCQSMLYQILCGLKYMHSANILHTAIQPQFLMLNTNSDLKICCWPGGMTTWDYMAPELLFKPLAHTTASDVWAAGLVFFELMTRSRWRFQATSLLQQVGLIVELVGTPPEDELRFMTGFGKKILKQAPFCTRKPFIEKFPLLDPLGMDLAQKMLAFDPGRRITVDEALAHPYLKVLHEKNEELVCMSPISSDLEQQTLTMDEIKGLMYQEAISCNT